MKKALYAGFDIGGTRIKFGAIDGTGKVLYKNSIESPGSIDGLMGAIKGAWNGLKENTDGVIRACGFGFAGFYSLKDGKVLRSPNYPSLDGFPLHRALGRIIDVPYEIDNDANMAAFGEYAHGAGKGIRNMVFLTVGTGIGSGLILDGRLYHGKCGFAGELGHITVNPDGLKCGCGSRGCLETEASATSLVRNYLAFSGKDKDKDVTSKDVYLLARKGDRAALKSFARCGRYLGIGLGIVISFLTPEKILIGGGVVSAGKYILDPARKEAEERSNPILFRCTGIDRARLGNDAGLIGAAAWARLGKAQRA